MTVANHTAPAPAPAGVAVITGGAGGIATALAMRLARRGWALGLVDRPGADLSMVRAGLAPTTTLADASCDLSDWGEAQRAVPALCEQFGHVDRLVNLVGVFHKRSFLRTPAPEWQREIVTNVCGPAHAIRAALPYLLDRGGRVINVCSIWSTRAGPDRSAYIAAKHALLGLTKALAAEFQNEAVEFVAVSPGPVDTPMTESLAAPEVRATWMTPDEIASLLEYAAVAPDGMLDGSELQAYGTRAEAGSGTVRPAAATSVPQLDDEVNHHS